MIGSILLRYGILWIPLLVYHSSKHAYILNIPVFQGGIVFSNIVTTVSPTYAQEVRTAEV